MTDQQTLSALFEAYVNADRKARGIEITWRESSAEFQTAKQLMLKAWKKYKAEKDRQENKKEKL